MESYAYAAAIERYYSITKTFLLGQQGVYLPDFGRYHLNHPIGHALAGWFFDIFQIPALTWIVSVNGIAAILAGFFLYAFLLKLRFSKLSAVLTTALFQSTNAVLLSTLSGEWHMPALALSLAGMWQTSIYLFEGKTKNLILGAVFFSLSVAYHLSIFFLPVFWGITLFIFPSPKIQRKALVVAAIAFAVFFIIIYVAIPVVLFDFHSFNDYTDVFFIYKNISHIKYTGLSWFETASRTIFHSVIFTPTGDTAANIWTVLFWVCLIYCIWRFARLRFLRPAKIFILSTISWWLIAHWLTGARPDGINGWMLISPLICVVFVRAISQYREVVLKICILPIMLLFCWNFFNAIYPNSSLRPNDLFFFTVPENTSASTPILFMIDNPVLAFNEMWAAGSVSGFRGQGHFFPRFGGSRELAQLRTAMRRNSGFILVREGNPNDAENLLFAEGYSYKKWSDKKKKFSEHLIPSTIYFKRKHSFHYTKEISVWLPTNLSTTN